jgi:diamine N-acetyltransferase
VKPETSFHPQLIVRRGKPDDAKLLSELGERTFSETFAVDNTPENMAAYLASSFTPKQQAAELADPRCLYLIAETDGKAVGYAMLRSGDAPAGVNGRAIELVRLYVTQESIGSGVGAALMKNCLDEAHRLGFVSLWLGVWEHNLRAQAFYRKWNFQEVGTHVFQLGSDPQTDLLMQRSIA